MAIAFCKTMCSISEIMETKCKTVTMNNNTKKVGSCTLLQNNEDYREKENIDYSGKLLSFVTHDNALFSKNQDNFTSVDRMNKSFKNLKITSYNKYIEGEGGHLAGEIKNIIDSLEIVLVKPCSPDILLYFGTPLFLNTINSQNYKTEYILLGYIDDIFGSVREPMYSVPVICNSKNILNIDTQVYYFSNNSSTLHMFVEHIKDNSSNKEKYSITTKKL